MESTAQTLVNTVNCVGIMGKGVALEFKKREPKMFSAYKKICDRKLLEPGKLWLWQGNQSWVLNFPTKQHWRNPSKIEWIEAGLEKFVSKFAEMGIREASFPRLGCGNGGLDWDDVRPMMEKYLTKIRIPIYIHDYSVDIGLPEHLEAISEQLSLENRADLNFETFMSLIMRAIQLAGSDMFDLSSRQPFKITQARTELTIAVNGASYTLDEDDIWGVWIGLQTGLLTQEKAGWSQVGAGRPLMSLLGLLPQLRVVEIQKAGEAIPELAIELRPRQNATLSMPVMA